MVHAKTARYWALITYLSSDQLIKRLMLYTNMIRSACFILHNMDDCVPHIHLLLRTSRSLSDEYVLSWFTSGFTSANTLIERCVNPTAYYHYMLHEGQLDKQLYKESDIVSFGLKSDIERYRSGQSDPQDSLVSAYMDLLTNQRTVQECLLEYGRDFIIHYPKIRALLRLAKPDFTDGGYYYD